MPVRRHGSRGRMRETWPSARYDFAMRLLAADPTYVGEWQSQKSVEGANTPYEILNASFEMPMPETLDEAVRVVGPNISWAEDHFQERVSDAQIGTASSRESVCQYWSISVGAYALQK